MNTKDKIYIAGHRGLVGSAIKRCLEIKGYSNIITRKSSELDLRNQSSVAEFFKTHKPEYVFLAAAKVGGIHSNNTYRADFIYDNICIQTNVIHNAFKYKIKKLLFLGSTCIYPKQCPQPIREEYLLNGYLEPTNQPYAIAKIAGIEMCQSYKRQYGCNFISCMPTNLYGPNDNYDLENSHVIAAFIRKFIEAKKQHLPSVTIWGTGTPRREFLYSEDLADACVFLMNNYDDDEIINVGTGTDIAIKDLAELVKKIVGYEGKIEHDLSKPDGTKQKLTDVSKINDLGWKNLTSLEDGLKKIISKVYDLF